MTLMTEPADSGEETPLESLSASSISGLKMSNDSKRGRIFVTLSSFPGTARDARRTSGNALDLLVRVANSGFCLSSSFI